MLSSIPAVNISYNKLLARLGYLQAKTKLDEKTSELIKENLNLAQKLIKPKVIIVFEKLTVAENLVSFEDGYTIESYDVANLLKDSFKAYGIAVTIGRALEHKRSAFLQNKETFNALILDASGSVAVEELITQINMQLKTCEEKENNTLTKRYSPGYGDWRLEANKEFLNWIGANQIGIKLNEFYQMSPEKSVSALIGVKENKCE